MLLYTGCTTTTWRAPIFGSYLRRQRELQSLGQQPQIRFRLRVSREGELTLIGGRHVNVDHLHGGKFL